MPRKKATTEEGAKPRAPKRTRRTASKRVATAASTPAPERPRIMSSEEKRQLILAHAAERQPVDTIQRFSLWTGVIVCILAITVGWVYTMRQSIASAIAPGGEGAEDKMDYANIKNSIHENINDMVDEIDNLQDEHLIDLKEQAAMLQAIEQEKASTSTEISTSSKQVDPNSRNDLFQPTGDTPTDTSGESSDFQIPPGVTIDTLNNN